MKIRGVTTWTENLELTRPYRISYETIDSVENVFVKIELENGNEIEFVEVKCIFQIDSEGKGKIILPDNAEIFFEDNPKTIGRNNFLEFMNSVNLDPFEISRKQFTISRE